MNETHRSREHVRIPAAVVSGTGYGGVELLRLLSRHPGFDLIEVTARSAHGRRVCDVFPQLPDLTVSITERVERAELVFLAQPDHAAIEAVPALLAAGRRVVDLSAAFRLRAPSLYPEWYGYEHPAPALLEEAVYGLPELHRAALAEARLVACPGCYPTAAVLALAPALAHALIEPGIVVDAKSGLSGAGRGLTLETHFAEASEDVSAYGLGGHRHWPEIVQALAAVAYRGATQRAEAATPAPLRVSFIPHLVPMARGILAQPPHTKFATGTNHAFVHPVVDARAGRLVVVAAIDNLGKGAAGQAVQCANGMYHWPETLGLESGGVYP